MSPATRNRGQDMRLRTRIHDALISFMRGSPHLGVAIGAWPESAVSVDDAWVFAEGTTCWPHVSLPDRRTVWQIGSVTKTFTATMLAATVRDGRIDLVDTVEKFAPIGARLPCYTNWQGSIAIRFQDLATHTAGLPTDPAIVPAGGYSIPEMYQDLARYALAVPPARNWNYSNVGFALLAHVLSTLANRESYEEMVRSLIVDLGLSLPASARPGEPARGLPMPDLADFIPVSTTCWSGSPIILAWWPRRETTFLR